MQTPGSYQSGAFHALATAMLVSSSIAFAQDEIKEAFELSPFEVDASQDSGYRATNTLAGTRLNSSLKDTAASISVWTEEFLQDTGYTDIEELILYSTNTVIDTADAGGGDFFNTFTNAANVLQPIRTRGINASQGIDYFKSIIPNDSYRVGRYDDSRGPNGVLFGVSEAGGLVNQSLLPAYFGRDSGRIRYSFGSNDRNRIDFRHNKVIAEDKFAIAIAGVYQDNGHWRDFASDEKKRIYAAAKWRISEKVIFQTKLEDGLDHRTTVQPTTPTDEGLPFYDHLMAFGADAVTYEPDGGNPSNAMRLQGISIRDGNPRNFSANGQNRFTYVVNDNFFYNATGTYRTGGYNRSNVAHPDGTPGGADRRMRINDPELIPFERFPAGYDHFRETDFDMISGLLDVTLTPDWFFNVQFATQSADIQTYSLAGPRPEFFGEPNTTRGLDGPENPFAGSMYFDGEWRNDTNLNQFRELRASTSYNLQTDSKWLGRHQIAVSGSQTVENQERHQKEHVLGGNPAGRATHIDRNGNRYQNAGYNHADNRIQIRRYIDLNDYSTWRAGGWSELPQTLTTDRFTGEPTEYPTVFAYSTPGNLNYLADFTTDSLLAVTQSRFWSDRLVFTLGYRKDEVNITRYGHIRDSIRGWDPDKSITADSTATDDIIPASPEVDFSGSVRTSGLVFHANENFSFVANESSSVGVPDFRRTVFPDGRNADPSDGEGRDFGVDFTLFDNRLNGRLVYYETQSLGLASGGRNGTAQMENIYDTYEELLEGAALEDLLSQRQLLRPEVNGKIGDVYSEGYELRLTANLTENWRLNFNAAHTDRLAQNIYRESQKHLGLMKGSDGLVIQGATIVGDVEDPNDPGSTIEAYTIDPSAYTSDGVIASFLEFGNQLPDTYNLQNSGISFQLWDMVDDMNDRIQQDEKRWGLRPWRFNLYTAYDFNEGLLNGWTTGGGYRWTAANILGEFDDGNEIEGDATAHTDFFLRYRTKQLSPIDGGSWTFQVNVYNIFDDRDIVANKLGVDGDPDYRLPGGRGVGYSRFDVVAPREFRFTATLDF